MNDSELIKKYQDWGLEYFWILYDRYIDKIYKFIYLKTSDRETAEDITSDVFYKVLNSINNFENKNEEKSFQSWIYRIANNAVIDFYRTKKEEISIDTIFDIPEEIHYGVNFDNKEKLQKIKIFLETLKADKREVILLRIWEDLSYKEIAEITWKSIDNCKKIVSRWLQMIQAHFLLIFFLIILL